MTFLATVPPDEATGAVAEQYAADEEALGFLPNFTRAFSLRPDVYAAWKALSGVVREEAGLRRYELATFAAARELRSTYCALAHGKVILDHGFLDADALVAPASESLDGADRAVMELAALVARDATAVTPAHLDRLRTHGLTDPEILDVILAAAVRAFFSKVLDATGAAADPQLAAALDPSLRDVLTVGRPPAAS